MLGIKEITNFQTKAIGGNSRLDRLHRAFKHKEATVPANELGAHTALGMKPVYIGSFDGSGIEGSPCTTFTGADGKNISMDEIRAIVAEEGRFAFAGAARPGGKMAVHVMEEARVYTPATPFRGIERPKVPEAA